MAVEVPNLPPVEAIEFFRRKGFAFGFAWQDVWQEEHVRAFTVAKAMSRDLLEDIRGAVDAAIADGRTLRQFSEELQPLLEAKGWWGRKPMQDPLTGETKTVQLGSPRRLKTIFNVNMRMAYQAGRWQRMERTKAAFPYVRYMSAGDAKVRPQHRAWHGVIKPIGDPWWNEHYPPCGWNCRCTAQPVNQRMMDRRGWQVTEKPPAFLPERYVNPRTGEVTMIEAGISPGFNYNVGKAYLDDLAAQPLAPPMKPKARTAADLSDADRDAIAEYTGPNHAELNRWLRGRAEEGDDLEGVEELRDRLDSAFEAVELGDAATLYRRIDDDYATELAGSDFKPGDILFDAGFMSTSRSREWASQPSPTRRRRSVLTVFAPQGAKALDIAALSRYSEEAEVLFARGVRLKIRRWDPANGVYEVEVVGDDPVGSLLDGQE